LTPCTVLTGFFLLGHCGRAGMASCAQCGRPICQEHYGPNGLCPECASQRAYNTLDPHDPSWTRAYRRWYYQRSSQTYNDSTWYSSFDSYDRGAFDPGSDWSYGSGDFGGSDDDTGFVDS
jgi:hypothetical protein